MMLSPQAARMGSASTMLGHTIRRSTRFWSTTTSTIGSISSSTRRSSRFNCHHLSTDILSQRQAFSSAGLSRFKSTLATYSDDEEGQGDDTNDNNDNNDNKVDHMDYRHQGMVAAAKARAAAAAAAAAPSTEASTNANAMQLHDDAWRINMGRDGDNEWLTGPRPTEWFTGVAPANNCPGTYSL
jgi:hypothetical protein